MAELITSGNDKIEISFLQFCDRLECSNDQIQSLLVNDELRGEIRDRKKRFRKFFRILCTLDVPFPGSQELIAPNRFS